MNVAKGDESFEVALPFDAFSPTEIEAIHREMTADVARLRDANGVYFVIGNYDSPQKERVELVRDELRDVDDYEAFILEEVGSDELQKFYLKFHLYLYRTDYVVGVFEDNDGGHELELGEASVGRTFVLKKDYPDEGTEHDRFDGMLAKLFEGLEYRGRLFRWTNDEELRAAVTELHESVAVDE